MRRLTGMLWIVAVALSSGPAAAGAGGGSLGPFEIAHHPSRGGDWVSTGYDLTYTDLDLSVTVLPRGIMPTRWFVEGVGSYVVVDGRIRLIEDGGREWTHAAAGTQKGAGREGIEPGASAEAVGGLLTELLEGAAAGGDLTAFTPLLRPDLPGDFGLIQREGFHPDVAERVAGLRARPDVQVEGSRYDGRFAFIDEQGGLVLAIVGDRVAMVAAGQDAERGTRYPGALPHGMSLDDDLAANRTRLPSHWEPAGTNRDGASTLHEFTSRLVEGLVLTLIEPESGGPIEGVSLVDGRGLGGAGAPVGRLRAASWIEAMRTRYWNSVLGLEMLPEGASDSWRLGDLQPHAMRAVTRSAHPDLGDVQPGDHGFILQSGTCPADPGASVPRFLDECSLEAAEALAEVLPEGYTRTVRLRETYTGEIVTEPAERTTYDDARIELRPPAGATGPALPTVVVHGFLVYVEEGTNPIDRVDRARRVLEVSILPP